jgi:hypothetical protein
VCVCVCVCVCWVRGQESWVIVITSLITGQWFASAILFYIKLSHYCHTNNKGERMYSSTQSWPQALDGGEWSASHLCFIPMEKTPSTHWIGGWVGLRAGLDTEARGKILCLCQGSNPNRPINQSVVRHYTNWATQVTYILCLIHYRLTANIAYIKMKWKYL